MHIESVFSDFEFSVFWWGKSLSCSISTGKSSFSFSLTFPLLFSDLTTKTCLKKKFCSNLTDQTQSLKTVCSRPRMFLCCFHLIEFLSQPTKMLCCWQRRKSYSLFVRWLKMQHFSAIDLRMGLWNPHSGLLKGTLKNQLEAPWIGFHSLRKLNESKGPQLPVYQDEIQNKTKTESRKAALEFSIKALVLTI